MALVARPREADLRGPVAYGAFVCEHSNPVDDSPPLSAVPTVSLVSTSIAADRLRIQW